METLAHPRRHRSGPALRWQAWFTFQRRMRKAPASLRSIFSVSFIFHRPRRLSVSCLLLVLFPLVVVVVVVVVCPSSFLGRGTTTTRDDAFTNIGFDFTRFFRFGPGLSHRFPEYSRGSWDEFLRCACCSKGINIQLIAYLTVFFSFLRDFAAFATEEVKLFYSCREICLIFCHRFSRVGKM